MNKEFQTLVLSSNYRNRSYTSVGIETCIITKIEAVCCYPWLCTAEQYQRSVEVLLNIVPFPPCVACGTGTHFFFFISGAVSHLYPTKSTIPIAEISCSAPNREGTNILQLFKQQLNPFPRTLEGSGKGQSICSKLMLGLTTCSVKPFC